MEGSVEKQFYTLGSFEYPTGFETKYTPLSVNVTNVVGTSSLTASVTDATHPNAPFPEVSLSRYFMLTESGDLTADLIFQYIQEDVPASVNESTFILQRYDGVFTAMPTVLDADANTATTLGISSFSYWTMFGELPPTSARIQIGSGSLDAVNPSALFVLASVQVT